MLLLFIHGPNCCPSPRSTPTPAPGFVLYRGERMKPAREGKVLSTKPHHGVAKGEAGLLAHAGRGRELRPGKPLLSKHEHSLNSTHPPNRVAGGIPNSKFLIPRSSFLIRLLHFSFTPARGTVMIVRSNISGMKPTPRRSRLRRAAEASRFERSIVCGRPNS